MLIIRTKMKVDILRQAIMSSKDSCCSARD